MPNNFFWTSFKLEAIHDVLPTIMVKPRIHQGKSSFPNFFKNSFSFTRKATSSTILKEAEATPSGTLTE